MKGSKQVKDTSIRKASIINVIGKYLDVFVGLVFSAILSRILSPKEFGTVAVVTVYTSFFSLLANMGIGPAIIHNKELDETDNSHIYSYTIWIAIGISILFAVFSFPLSWFYQDSKYVAIGILLSFSLFFNTLNIVPNALLLKRLKFKTINSRLILVSVLSSTISIISAINGASYYAIIIKSILTAFLVFLWNYFTVKPSFVFKVDFSRIAKIKNFSSYQFAFNFINYFSRNLDSILIGKSLGEIPLGLYNKSYNLMRYPLQYLTHVISPVLHPILSKHSNDRKYIYEQYMKVIKVLSLLGVFITIFFFFASEEIILVMFGNQWGESVQSFKLLSLSIWAQMLSSSTGAIFQSLGDTKMMFKSGVFTAIIVISAILIGVVIADINAVAALVSLAYLIMFFITFFLLVKKSFDLPLLAFFKQLLPDFTAGAITFFAACALNTIEIQNSFYSLLFKAGSIGGAYLVSLAITGQLKYVSKLLFGKR